MACPSQPHTCSMQDLSLMCFVRAARECVPVSMCTSAEAGCFIAAATLARFNKQDASANAEPEPEGWAVNDFSCTLPQKGQVCTSRSRHVGSDADFDESTCKTAKEDRPDLPRPSPKLMPSDIFPPTTQRSRAPFCVLLLPDLLHCSMALPYCLHNAHTLLRRSAAHANKAMPLCRNLPPNISVGALSN